MSRLLMAIAVGGAALFLAGTCLAADDVAPIGSSTALDGSGPTPAFGPAPSGMRFGDIGHMASVEGVTMGYPGGGCPTCGFGVTPTCCDPYWQGPCMDWKVVGWYSHFECQAAGHGCRNGCAPCGSSRCW